jgi:hypothetical protein
MRKAILVIDMPESCSKCPLFNGYYADMSCGGLNNRGINYPYPEDFKQDWCPLKPMPERDEAYHLLEFDAGYKVGWNDCIKTISGENQ